MKKPILVGLMMALTGMTFAQQISFTPTGNMTGIAELEEYNIFQVYLHNDSDDALNLSWRIVENTLPEEWNVTLCDNVNCYGILPQSADLDPIAAADSAIMKIDVNPELVAGQGILRFFINETGSPNPYKELIFDISTGTTNTKDLFSGAVQIFPNPATEWVRIENQLDQNLQFQLIDQQGRLLRMATLNSEDQLEWGLDDLARGTYYLRMESNERVVVRTLLLQ
ncbi:MAG: T9SS type A sorting domain-containing protein [Bacteroidota bacterium]